MRMTERPLSIAIVALLIAMSSSAYAQSQTAMNTDAGAAYQKADKELNVVYQKILKEYASKTVFVKKLKVAQRLWVQLRDAELAARYPTGDSYGSAGPMCKAAYLESLTKERTRSLKQWLEGMPEGDVCNGSVKIAR
jgi:uncharacterized protein YecT (DUF1311 family)